MKLNLCVNNDNVKIERKQTVEDTKPFNLNSERKKK